MNAFRVDSRKTADVQTRDAQIKNTVVRGIGGNQACQPDHVWFAWARSTAGPPQGHYFAIRLHAFENTSFGILVALIASERAQQHRTSSSTSSRRRPHTWPGISRPRTRPVWRQ